MKQAEIFLISRYAAAELAGALLLGKYARNTKSDYVRKKLTEQCSEEARHAWLWTQMLEKKDIPLLEIHEKNEYFSYASSLQNEVEFLVWAHIYERRGDFHLRLHAQIPEIDSDLKKVMEQINQEEVSHLDWIPVYIKKLQEDGNKEIDNYFEKWGEIENRTYLEFVNKLVSSEDNYLQQLGKIIEKNLPNYALR